MAFPYLDRNRCLVCQPCEARAACKRRALVQRDEGDPPYIAPEYCNGCGLCVPACVGRAISMGTSPYHLGVQAFQNP